MCGITSVVLTYNEEINISHCLKSLQWTKRQIVVDSGSTDKTVEIAHGAEVVVHSPEEFTFADQRNWALENIDISTEWVLFIDADEEIPPSLAEQIVRDVQAATDQITAFQLAPKFIFMDQWLKHTMNYPAWHDRLIRYGRAKFQGDLWEKVKTDGKIKKISEPYLHYGLRKGLKPWMQKHVLYAHQTADMLRNLSKGENFYASDVIYYLFFGGSISKKKAAELLAAKWPLLGAAGRFLHYYIFRGGILDGKAGFVYSQLMAVYQFLISLF
ncbi:MAG: glycosyltransferase family 2 protein, partial [Candidatus Paceibacteria bacterium]